MSWKGHTFVEDDLAVSEVSGAKAKLGADYADWLKAKLDDLTRKYAIVAHDPKTNEDYIAEELDQRILGTLPDGAKSAAGMLASLSASDRLAVLHAFDSGGALISPFMAV